MASQTSADTYNWIDAHSDKAAAKSLAAAFQCPEWFASLLVSRGIQTAEEASSWLNPRLASLSDPFLLPGMTEAIERVQLALERGERITIFGDYDVDGITSSALMKSLLTEANAQVEVFLPHRLEEGYGLSSDALKRCIQETRPDLIITVDCGTGSVDSVQEASELSVDVIVTDHHAVSGSVAPAVAVVNPQLCDREELRVLAGVGVAFKFCHALIKHERLKQKPAAWANFDIRTVLDLVALGTIADLVPLTGENRILVHSGLKVLNRSSRVGIQALVDVARINKTIGTYEIGFQLAPRLNAAGRLGTAKTSLNLLLTDSQTEAHRIASTLDESNRKRQQVERTIVRKLLQAADEQMESGGRFSVVEADKEWHPGVIGIAAARVMQKHYRPTIVIGADEQGRAKGSCRSIAGFNMVEALGACSQFLTKYGGHAMAAGLEIEWDEIDAFRHAFESVARSELAEKELIPELTIDAWIDSRDIDVGTLELLEHMAPFGMGYKEPLWGCRGLALSGAAREVGKGHLKANFVGQGKSWEAIGFGLYSKKLPKGPIDAVFHLRKDEYLGNERLVMYLKDFRPSKSGFSGE